MPPSPASDSEGIVRVTVFSDGQPLADTVALISVSVSRAINAVPAAQIVVQDGDMADQRFEVSDGAVFRPGAAIKIMAGYGDVEETVFQGIVVKQGIKITGNNDSRLWVECQDKCVRMTLGRKNANHLGQPDSAVIGQLIAAHGLSADVQATALLRQSLVQYDCSDWDFMLTRADANGLLVVATDGKLSVKPPQVSGTPTLKVAYGSDLIEFHADVDARTQCAEAQGFSWDMKTQAVLQGDAAAPARLNAQGNLGGADLAAAAGLGACRLQSPAALSKAELDAWAQAQQVKAGLARVRGRMKFQGSAKAVVGELITVEGVGERFSGNVFVSAVRHEIADGNWFTEAQFGMSPQWFAERSDVTAPAASGLLPGATGLQIGVVTRLDGDPEGESRVQVTVPVLGAANPGVWARLGAPHGSDGFGLFFVPEVGDEVVLGYFNNDPSHPVIIGSLYSSKRPPPYPMDAANPVKAIVTRGRSKIEFNDDGHRITVTTPGDNKIVLSDQDKSIVLTDQNGNRVALTASGITLDSPKDIVLSAKGKITLDAVADIDLVSKADVTSAGLHVSCEAQVGFVAKGAASAELSATGQTVVKGAIVMIN